MKGAVDPFVRARKEASGSDRTPGELAELLRYIRDARGFDFAGYKQASLTRRIRKRMQEVGIAEFLDYRDLLESDSDEFRSLFNTILINVTAFFRDPEAWDYLRHEIVPDILARTDPGEEIRVWSAGCSSGEEAYSLAMIFGEVLGISEAVERLKIYGTDIDDEALAEARSGVFSAKTLEVVPEELRQRYFDTTGHRTAFRTDLRRRVIFGHHDITSDAPISRLDLLVCRNTMMYLNSEAQSHVIGRFEFALREGGYLFLGKAETLVADGERFETASARHRIFRRIAGRPETRYRHATILPLELHPSGRDISRRRQLRDLILDSTPSAAIAVRPDGTVELVNNQARAHFGLSSRDVGRPFHELEISYRPAELRSPIEQALAERRTVRLNSVERRLGPDELSLYDILVQPLSDDNGAAVGVAIHFVDTTTQVLLREEVKRTREDLETAYEELQSTNEELETTNEELQSSIEELETTNEELQSTNEELETTNQELQSGNGELDRMIGDARRHSVQLDEARTYLEGVLGSVPAGIVVLDAHLRVRSWSRGAEDLWGLRTGEVQDLPFFDLVFGLPTDKVREIVDSCMTSNRRSKPIHIDAVSRTGRSIDCAVVCSPLDGPKGGVVLLMEETDRT